MCKNDKHGQGRSVAPLVGAWIEIIVGERLTVNCSSLLLWERGLKSENYGAVFAMAKVAPLVGAWIEINMQDI